MSSRDTVERSNRITSHDGTRLWVEQWGAGPPVLLLHAWGCSTRMWDLQVPVLVGAGHHVVAIDRRGHGRSDVPGGGYDLDSLADDVAAVLDALDLHEAVVVGHSAGAQEAVRCVTRHGAGRVGGLVLSAPVTPCIQRRDDFPLRRPGGGLRGTARRRGWWTSGPGWRRTPASTTARPRSPTRSARSRRGRSWRRRSR